MPYRGLADFLSLLEEKEELRRVQIEVGNDEELAEVTSRVAAGNNAALLFAKVAGHRTPVVTNLFGNERRVCLGLGAQSLTEVAQRYCATWRIEPGDALAESSALAPKRVKTAPCQQVVRLGSDIDLAELPLPRRHGEPQSTQPAAVIHWRDATSRRRRACCLPVQVVDRARLGVFIPPGTALRQSLDEASPAGAHIPVAIAWSGDPSLWMAALLSNDANQDAALLAGALRGAPLELTTCRTHDLEAPAEAELIFEGHLNPRQMLSAAPFVDDLGWYAEPHSLCVLELSAVTHRASPILPAVISGQPPHELCNWRRVAARLLLPVVQSLAPEVIDYSLPEFGAAQHYCFVAIRKSHAHQAAKVARLLPGLSPLLAAKCMVVVDEQVDVHDASAVWRHVAANVTPLRDVQQMPGLAAPLDHSVPVLESGSHLVIDATRKLPGEHPREWPAPAECSEHISELVSSRWKQYGVG